jgi:hypothetical protein
VHLWIKSIQTHLNNNKTSLSFQTGPCQLAHTGPHAHTPFPFDLPCPALMLCLAVTRLRCSRTVVIGPPLHHSATCPIRRALFSHRPPAKPPHPSHPLVSKGVTLPPPSPFHSHALPYANSCAYHHPPPP